MKISSNFSTEFFLKPFDSPQAQLSPFMSRKAQVKHFLEAEKT